MEDSESSARVKLFPGPRRNPAETRSINMVGSSPSFRKLEAALKSAAEWEPDPVLLVGERGTGKGLAARALHLWSRRNRQRFLAIWMPALHDDLLVDELFGHKRNAYTGALERRKGAFEEAHRGTLFLDEIGEMRPASQGALLRVTDTGEIKPIGEDVPFRVNVRLITATNQDLRRLVREGKFRPELYDRLRFFEIRVPPLRERLDDIPALARHFLRECCQECGCALGKSRDRACRNGQIPECAADSFYQTLMGYQWPGNIRELRNIVRRSRAQNPNAILNQSHVAPLIKAEQQSLQTPPTGSDMSLNGISRRHIIATLERCEFKVKRAASELGIPRTTLRDKIRKLKINTAPFRDRD